MLALKKKREVEKKEREEAAKAAESAEAAAPANAPGGQVSLLGIGGKKTTKTQETTGIKKSPGEIRIQKGNFRILFFSCLKIVVSLSLSILKTLVNSMEARLLPSTSQIQMT
jgi:hypothetical protein